MDATLAMQWLRTVLTVLREPLRSITNLDSIKKDSIKKLIYYYLSVALYNIFTCFCYLLFVIYFYRITIYTQLAL